MSRGALIKLGSLFVILSNVNLSAEEMIKVARMRDCNEKAFKRMNNHFGLSKTYSHSAMTYEGKMFIAFVALITVETYRYYIRPVLNAISSITTRSTIGELNSVCSTSHPLKLACEY